MCGVGWNGLYHLHVCVCEVDAEGDMWKGGLPWRCNSQFETDIADADCN